MERPVDSVDESGIDEGGEIGGGDVEDIGLGS